LIFNHSNVGSNNVVFLFLVYHQQQQQMPQQMYQQQPGMPQQGGFNHGGNQGGMQHPIRNRIYVGGIPQNVYTHKLSNLFRLSLFIFG
jgi:hypothetical protein